MSKFCRLTRSEARAAKKAGFKPDFQVLTDVVKKKTEKKEKK